MGFWIRPDGKWENIPDHFNYVREHPVEFGSTKREAETWGLADRDAVLDSAKKRGFIRVRGTRPNLSMEFWELNNNTIANIKDFLVGTKIAPDEQILFEENLTGRTWYRTANWILADAVLAVAANKGKMRKKS